MRTTGVFHQRDIERNHSHRPKSNPYPNRFIAVTACGKSNKTFRNCVRPELESLCTRFVPEYKQACMVPDQVNGRQTSPFFELPPCTQSQAIAVAEASVGTRFLLDYWGSGASLEELCTDLAKISKEKVHSLIAASSTWSIFVNSIGVKCAADRQEAIRNALRIIPLQGTCSLDAPDHEFFCLQFVDLDIVTNQVVSERWVFGRRICVGGRHLMDKFTLRKRKYLGPTSTDAELAFFMANQALVRKGMLVIDPFVGTASLSIASAQRGAITMGTDFDYKTLHGMMRGNKGKFRIEDNYAQYGLGRPELLVADGAHSCFRANFHVDAIVCDPPYGVRAGARKSGHKDMESRRPINNRKTHIPTSQVYEVKDVMSDLMTFAARHLPIGGRLVYLLPSLNDFNPATDLPTHPCLVAIQSSRQQCAGEMERQIVTMEKTVVFDPTNPLHLQGGNQDGVLFERIKEVVYAKDHDKEEKMRLKLEKQRAYMKEHGIQHTRPRKLKKNKRHKQEEEKE